MAQERVSRKKCKLMGGGRVDHGISSLTDDLLVHILSHMTLTDAVRTSVLSKRWKHLSRLLPSLDFETCYRNSWSKKEAARHASSIMSTVLAGAAGPLSDVTLYLPYGFSGMYKQMDSLITRAMHRNVRGCLTVVVTYPFPRYVFPLRFLNCTPITQLHVSGVIFCTKNTRNFCLRALKSLHLSEANVEEAELERLTSSACCPVLETLKLSNCKNEVFEPLNVSLTNSTVKHLHIFSTAVYLCREFEICAPHVTRLELTGSWRAYALKDLSSLSEATFDFDVYPYNWWENYKVVALRTLNGIFNAISTSIKVYFSAWFLQVLHMFEKQGRTVSQVRVKHVIVKTGTDFSDIPTLASFLQSCSEVEHLTVNLSPKVHLNLNLCPPECPCFKIALATQGSDDAGKMYCMLLERSLLCNYKLRTIVVEGFYGRNDTEITDENYYAFVRRSWQFELVRIMLGKIMNLEKMIIQSSPKQLKIPSQITEMCCSLPKASSTAVLVFPFMEGSPGVRKNDFLCSCKLTTSGCGDRLSKLPDKLLLHILSFLSLQKAVITSTLSRRWRKLWTLLPALDFTILSSRFGSHSFEIINYVLTMHKAPKLSAFSMSFRRKCLSMEAKLDSWIAFAVSRHVCSLDMHLPDYVLPPYLFHYSSSLARLRVSCCTIVLPQHPFCLSSLKFMHICDAELEQLVLERLTSSACCPVLETLQITCCNNFIPLRVSLTNPNLRHLCIDNNASSSSLDICAPHVTHLELHGKWTDYVLKDVSSLTEATLDFNEIIPSSDAAQTLLVLKNLISTLPPSIRLTLSRSVVQVFSDSALLERGAAPVKVKHLTLRTGFDMDNILDLALLCRSSHDIESLTLNLAPSSNFTKTF